MKLKTLEKICVSFICLVFGVTSTLPISVQAKTIEEINQEIQATQDALNKIKAELAKANQNLLNTQNQKNSTSSELNRVKASISEIEQTINVNNLQKEQLDGQIQLQELQKEEVQNQQNKQIVDSYISWKVDDSMNSVFANPKDVFKTVIYYEYIAKETEKQISDLAISIDELNTTSENFKKQTEELQAQILGLNTKKAFWEEQIRLYEESLAKAKSTQSSLQASSSQLQEQQQNLNVELERAIAAAASGSQPLTTGQTYFYGTVSLPRNNIECTGSNSKKGFEPSADAVGHGIGMSQWGANGMAWKGRTASQILTFYYPGTAIVTKPTKDITVNGTVKMNMEVYVSGIGEVSSKACGSMDQINAWNDYSNAQGWSSTDPRRDKYRLGGDCWPEEAIKAQVIAARTYAYNRSTSICTTDACQVYSGGTAKAWAAWETKDQLVVKGSEVINTFYSAYNNNGAGNADIDSVWTKNSPVSYLTSVNDNSLTSNPKFCGQNISRQTWRSNSYSIADFQAMLNWGKNPANWGSGDYNFYESEYWNYNVVQKLIVNKIGNLASLQIINDASGRAKDVVFTGTNGNKATISGLFFRILFGVWAVKNNKNDGIKSITYTMAVAQ